MKKTIALFSTFILSLVLLTPPPAQGQGRITYRDLVNRSSQKNIYIDFFTLPDTSDESLRFISTFRIDYSFLPFRKVRSSSDSEQFFSTVELNMEVFKANERRRKNQDISIRGLKSVARAAWKDTAYAETYEQTQSKKMFTGGFMEVPLPPGLYNYMLQLNQDERSEGQRSRVQQVELTSFSNKLTAKPIFIESTGELDTKSWLNLMNFGENVYYGKDFYALTYIPDFDPEAEYTLRVNIVNIAKDDTTTQNQVFSKKLTSENFRDDLLPSIREQNDNIMIALHEGEGGHSYAITKIPNSTFPNSTYRFEITKNGKATPVSAGIFRSLWIDMPTSLLNVDVAINMLRFIVSDAQLKELKKGSKSQQERKFREFWKEKDPTPDTEFNELMAEYYRRIDYAYEQFTTPNTIGYESDRGEIYIKYGPPKSKDRTFPAGEPAVEVWTYDNRRFIFQATSGFGDFRLVNSQ